MKRTLLLMMVLTLAIGHNSVTNSQESAGIPAASNKPGTMIATFAGGCFWCTESDFEKLPGVQEVVSGYTGGSEKNPTYQEVSSGSTGHVEAIQIHYDYSTITYEQLLDHLWKHIDPTDSGGQFVDRGPQYRSAIFYHDEKQKRLAEKMKEALEKSGRFTEPIVTDILPFSTFYKAEAYHQDYYKTHPMRYQRYRRGSGRDQFLKSVWGNGETTAESAEETEFTKPQEEELRESLTPLQYKVTQEDGTEPPFRNEYWDNKQEGIYVDVVSGEPLFSSRDKFESGTGWPSFTRPLEPDNVVEKEDYSLFMKRIEVRSKNADSHLGHVFPDGPEPTGLRYCINSAALRFIPEEDLGQGKYAEYSNLFDN